MQTSLQGQQIDQGTMDEEALMAVILDNGTSTVKAGFSGEDAPRVEVNNVVGSVRHPGLTGIALQNEVDNYTGMSAVKNAGLLNAVKPMKRREVTNWAEMEQLWHHTFAQALRTSAEEHPILISEAQGTSRVDREKTTQLFFESFNAPALVISNQLALSLFSTGRSTGLVVDSGASRTDIGAVWEGYTMPHECKTLDLGGDDVTQFLFDRLKAEGYPFSTAADWDLVASMKEEYCYACGDAEKELKFCRESRSIERLYDLPDGQQIYLNDHRFLSTEVMFNPEPLGITIKDALGAMQPAQGLHRLINDTIAGCHEDIRAEMYGNIVLSGGNSLFPKMDERIQREVSMLIPREKDKPSPYTVKCVAFPDRKYATWLGGSILGSLSTFPCMWVSKSEYDDYGASIIHRKC